MKTLKYRFCSKIAKSFSICLLIYKKNTCKYKISKFTKTAREKQIFQLVGISAPYYNLLLKNKEIITSFKNQQYIEERPKPVEEITNIPSYLLSHLPTYLLTYFSKD